MFMTKKISKDVCAVIYNDPPSIMIRRSGKEFFCKEKELVLIKNNKLTIDREVAGQFGIEIEIK